MLPMLWRAVATGHGIHLALFGVVAFGIGSLSTIVLLRRRCQLTDRICGCDRHLSQEETAAVGHALAAERRRIAGEVQDIVAHRLATITVLSEGASVTTHREPDVAAEAMTQIATTSRHTLHDLGRFLANLLHESSSPDSSTDPW